MNSKNQGRRVLVVLAGLGFLILVGLLAPPAQFTVTGVKVKTKTAILRQPVLPQTITLVPKQTFESGWGAWTIAPAPPSSSYPIWNLLAPFQCDNQQNTQMAGFKKLSTCQYGSGLNTTQTLSSPTFNCPAAPTGSTSSAISINLDYQRQMAGSATTILWIDDGIGSNAITMFPDNSGNVVQASWQVPNPAGYLTTTNKYDFQVTIPVVGTGNGLNVDNVESKLVYAANLPCNQIVAQIMREESVLVPGGYCTLIFPNPTATSRFLIFDFQALTPAQSPALIPANLALGSNFSDSCQAMNPVSGMNVILQIDAGSTSIGFELPSASHTGINGNYKHHAQIHDPGTGEISPVIMIPVSEN